MMQKNENSRRPCVRVENRALSELYFCALSDCVLSELHSESGPARELYSQSLCETQSLTTCRSNDWGV